MLSSLANCTRCLSFNCTLQEATSLPFQVQPHDALRQGLVTLKDGAAAVHPVETIQKMAGPAAEAARYDMLRNLYGTALPARMQIERQILDRQAGWLTGSQIVRWMVQFCMPIELPARCAYQDWGLACPARFPAPAAKPSVPSCTRAWQCCILGA